MPGMEKKPPPPEPPAEKRPDPPDAFPYGALAFLAWPALIFVAAEAGAVHLIAFGVLCTVALLIRLASAAPDARQLPPAPARLEARPVAKGGCAVCGLALEEPMLSCARCGVGYHGDCFRRARGCVAAECRG